MTIKKASLWLSALVAELFNGYKKGEEKIADRRDVDFVLHEQLGVEELSQHDIFAEFNKKTIDLIISEARNLAIKEILPTQVESDREGTPFDAGK